MQLNNIDLSTNIQNTKSICNQISKKVFKKILSIEDFLPQNASILKDFTCTLCKGIFFDPIFVECGHSFCKECINISIEIIDLCPICNKQISKDNFKDAIYYHKVINKQDVICKNKILGCSWTGKLSDREQHLENYCEKRIIDCDKCLENNILTKGYPDEIKNHKENFCDFEIIECEKKCGNLFKRIEKNLHFNNCPKESINCPMKCGNKINRESIDSHIEKDCPLQNISCKFSEFFCEERFLRKNLINHLNNYKHTHNKNIIVYLSNFEKNIKEENFFKNIIELENKIKLKENLLDNKIELLVKELEEIKRKNEIFEKQREEAEKLIQNGIGLDDYEIKKEEIEQDKEDFKNSDTNINDKIKNRDKISKKDNNQNRDNESLRNVDSIDTYQNKLYSMIVLFDFPFLRPFCRY